MMTWFSKIFSSGGRSEKPAESGAICPGAENAAVLCSQLEALQQCVELETDGEKLVALYQEMSGLLEEMSTDLFFEYSYKLSEDGVVSFRLPQGKTYMDLFNAANQHAAKHR